MTLKIQLNASNNGKQELVSIATEHYHPLEALSFPNYSITVCCMIIVVPSSAIRVSLTSRLIGG